LPLAMTSHSLPILDIVQCNALSVTLM